MRASENEKKKKMLLSTSETLFNNFRNVYENNCQIIVFLQLCHTQMQLFCVSFNQITYWYKYTPQTNNNCKLCNETVLTKCIIIIFTFCHRERYILRNQLFYFEHNYSKEKVCRIIINLLQPEAKLTP